MSKALEIRSVRSASPPVWWWLGLAAMALLFALLRVLLEMDSARGPAESALSSGGGEFIGAGGLGLTALEALLRSCLPPAGAGAEEWWLWAFFMTDIGVMGVAAFLAVWFYARPRMEGLGAAARIPLEDESDA